MNFGRWVILTSTSKTPSTLPLSSASYSLAFSCSSSVSKSRTGSLPGKLVLRPVPTAWEDSDEMELVLMSCVPLNCCNRRRSANVGVGVGVGLGRRGWLDVEVLRVSMTGTANANRYS
jgi:hypothetical protein